MMKNMDPGVHSFAGNPDRQTESFHCTNAALIGCTHDATKVKTVSLRNT